MNARVRTAVAAIVVGMAAAVIGFAPSMTHDNPEPDPQAAQCRCMTHDDPEA